MRQVGSPGNDLVDTEAGGAEGIGPAGPTDLGGAGAPPGRLRSGRGIIGVSRLASFPWQSSAVILVLLVAWELVVRGGYQDEFWVSRPTLVVRKIGDWIQDGTLTANLFPTLRVAATSFCVSALGALVVGLLFARVRWLDEVLGWYLDLIYAVPKPALVPLFLFAFGLGDKPKYLLVISLVFFVFYYNVRAGLTVPMQSHRDSLLILGAKSRDIWTHLTLPTLLPFLVASARLGAALAVLGTVFAEFFAAATPGMGRLVITAQQRIDSTSLLSVVVLLAAIGALVDSLLRRFDRKMSGWRL